MLLDGVMNKSAIFVFFPSIFACVTGLPEVNFLLIFYNDRTIYWACAGKENIKAFSACGSFCVWGEGVGGCPCSRQTTLTAFNGLKFLDES